MTKETVSEFNESPKSKMGWWAFGLSIGAILSGPILGIFAAIIRPFLDRITDETIGAVAGFGFGALVIAVIFVDLELSIMTFRRGERSWAVWVALIFSSLAVCMFTFMIVGEVIFPH